MFFNPFISLWNGIIAVLPKLIVAIIVFVIGWIIAKIIYKALIKIGKSLKLDELVKPMAGAFEKAGYKLSLTKAIAFLVKWFVAIGFLVVALDVLGLQTTKLLLLGIIAYIPQVIIAIFVLIAGVVLANFTKKLIQGSTKVLRVKSATFLSNLARVVIIVFTALIALDIIGLKSQFINILFIGVVAMFALAGGLAFGLGGRDAAAKLLEKFYDSMNK